MSTIAVLAVQGGYHAHGEHLRALGHEVLLLRHASEISGDIQGLVLPGGESSAQRLAIARAELEAPLKKLVDRGTKVLCTCAGLILAARKVADEPAENFAWLDIEVERNAYGAQVHSFEAVSDGGRALVFIRAPKIVSVGREVEVIDSWSDEPIFVRQGGVYACTFHPELTSALDIHEHVFGRAVSHAG